MSVVKELGDRENSMAVLAFLLFREIFTNGSFLLPAERERFELFLFTGATQGMRLPLYHVFFAVFCDGNYAMATCALEIFSGDCFYRLQGI